MAAKSGHLTVITGPMKSGKSEEVLKHIRVAEIAGIKVQSFIPAKDARNRNVIASRNSLERKAIPLPNAEFLTDSLEDRMPGLVVVDEVQFFDGRIVEQVELLLMDNHRVIVAGLSLDANGFQFGPMHFLMPLADTVITTRAVCAVCKSVPPNAMFSQLVLQREPVFFHKQDRKMRLVNKDYEVRKEWLVGEETAPFLPGDDEYEPRCRACFVRPPPTLR